MVLDAALSVADRSGLRRVTIRALAAELGAPPMTLYAHFSGKEQLYDLMFVRLLQRLFAGQDGDTWQAEFETVCRHARSVLLAHPHWIPLLTRVTAPTSSLGFYDRLLKLMALDGFSWEAAMHAFSSAMSFTLGMVLVERAMTGHKDAPVPLQRLRLVKKLIPTLGRATYPHIAAAAPIFDRWSFDNVFDLGLSSLVAGIETHGTRRRRATKSAPRRV
jgi:AcrR family transcriptional regulator